jgi:hypothetical protein
MFLHELQTIIHKFNSISGLRAVVAGGCLRDLLYGKESKDIDLFVVVPEDFPYKTSIDLAQALADELNGCHSLLDCLASPSVHPKGSSTYDDFKLRKEVLHVVGIPATTEIPTIDIIYMNEDAVGTKNVSDTFDFTINMVEYDGHTLYKSNGFIDTMNTKNIRQVRDNVDCNAERTQKRIEKLSNKFPEHTWTFLNNSELPKTTTSTLICPTALTGE